MMKRASVIVATLGLGALFSAQVPAAAELIVIYAHPDARPITDFLNIPQGNTKQQSVPEPPVSPSGVMDVRALLPIHSPELTPGPVTQRRHELLVAQPLFLIGVDPLSRAWLSRHQSRLRKLGAVGMLVEAETQADLEVIAELAGDLPIVPASASDIARALNLQHYPVCITGKRIWQ